jgi:polysaccharide biosynthesis transport protein
VNAFCEEFIRYNSTIRTERSGESVDFLEELVASKRKDLDEKLETQRIFKSSNSFFNVEREGESRYAQLNDLEKQRDEIRSTIQRIEITRNKLNEQILNIGGAGSLITDNQKVLELRNTINRLNEQYIIGGQTSAALRDSISMLREQLRAQTDMQVTNQPTSPITTKADIMNKLNELDVEYQVAKSSLSSVDAKIRSLQYSFAGYASKEAKLAAIQQEIDVASKEYLESVNKFNEAKNKFLSSATLRQINVALPPLNPLASKRFLIVGLAIFSSFSICIFIIVLFEFLDQSIRSLEKFNSMIDLPLIGSIIRMETKNFNIPKIFNQTDENGEIFKSSLRKLRHEIVSLNASVILFTSLRKNEGKTFVIVALSYVLSLIDKRILVVDTNFRNNSLSTILPKSQIKARTIESRKPVGLIGQGDSEKSRNDETDSGYELISPSVYKNIFIVTNNGEGAASPAEILSGRDFKILIEKFKGDFDYIFLEGGALNDFADTKELVQYVDKVVTIISAQATTNQQDKVSIEYLRALGLTFAGCVLNRIDSKDYKS